MKFIETILNGAYVVEPEKVNDERGFFSRIWCQKEFKAYGLDPVLAQANIAFSKKSGTLRGMHFQIAPHEETKLLYCSKGSIYDVIIDLRSTSKTFKKWFSIKLTAENHKMLYVPKGFAHGYQTLEDNTEVIYWISEFYTPESYSCVRWNDPTFGIIWPKAEHRIISEQDKNCPDFKS